MVKAFRDNVRGVLAGVCCAAVMMCAGVEGMMIEIAESSDHSVVENFYTAAKNLSSGSSLNRSDYKFNLASLALYSEICKRPKELLGSYYFLFCIHWKGIADLLDFDQDPSLQTHVSCIVKCLPTVLQTALPQKKASRVLSNLGINAASFPLTDKQLSDIQKILRYCFIETRSQLE
jgi:hypothetical protein